MFLIKDCPAVSVTTIVYEPTVELDCSFLPELCENIQKGIGISFYKTGEKRIEVNCQNTMDWWDPSRVTYYYRNGNKKSEEIYYGCGTESGPYTTWWENGNLKSQGFQGFPTEEWYENGQVKEEMEITYGPNGLGDECVSKAVSYYENGQIKSLFKCEDCIVEGDCPPEKCWDEKGNEIECEY